MKKEYKKPAIYMESFSLTQTIAYGCGAIANDCGLGKPGNLAEKDACGWDMGSGLIVWLEGTVCTYEIEKDADFGGVCYNNPGMGNSIFTS